MQPEFERRSTPRVAVEFPVFFFYLPPNSATTKMLDLSVEGAAVEALDPLPLGAEAAFIFVMDEHTAVECSGRVMHVLPLPNNRFRIGLQFTRLNANARKSVAQVTEREGIMQ